MNFIRMAKDNLFKQIKSYSLFIITVAISTAVIFNSMNITMNEEIMKSLGEYAGIMSLSAFFLVFTSVMMSGYISFYFITSKTKEIGVIGISGGSVLYTATYLSVQNIIIEFIGAAIGIVLGLAISPLYIILVKANLDVGGATLNISSLALYLTIAWVFIQAAYALVLGVGYAYRRTIRELMVEQQTSLPEDKRSIKLSSGVYILLYVISNVLLYMIGGTEALDVAPYISVIAIAGTFGIIKYFIPKVLDKKRKEGKLYESEKMIWTGNVSVLLSRTTMLLVSMMIGIVSVDCLIILERGSTEIIFMLSLQLVTFLILISLAIAYKIFAEIYSRREQFHYLNIMGYSKAQLNSTIKKEIIVYFLVFMIIALLPVVVICASSIIKGTISIGVCMMVLLPPIVVIIMVGIISYLGYKRVVFERI